MGRIVDIIIEEVDGFVGNFMPEITCVRIEKEIIALIDKELYSILFSYDYVIENDLRNKIMDEMIAILLKEKK